VIVGLERVLVLAGLAVALAEWQLAVGSAAAVLRVPDHCDRDLGRVVDDPRVARCAAKRLAEGRAALQRQRQRIVCPCPARLGQTQPEHRIACAALDLVEHLEQLVQRHPVVALGELGSRDPRARGDLVGRNAHRRRQRERFLDELADHGCRPAHPPHDIARSLPGAVGVRFSSNLVVSMYLHRGDATPARGSAAARVGSEILRSVEGPMTRRLFCLLISIATLAGVAYAQPAARTKTTTAKAYTEAGLAAQNAGDYDRAIEFYRSAYELVPHPVLLFNMGQAHRLAGRNDEALALYRRYLEADPNGSEARTAQDLINEIEARRREEARKAEEGRRLEDARKADEARAKAEEARRLEEARKADVARQAEEARKAEATRQAEAARNAQEERKAEEAREAIEGPGRTRRWLGIGVAGAGVVAVGVSIGYGLRAASLSDELSDPDRVFDQQKYDRGQTAENIQIAAGIAGGVAVLAGAVVYWTGRPRAVSDRVSVAPWLAPGTAGVTLSGSLR
jgi:hypothetical protein